MNGKSDWMLSGRRSRLKGDVRCCLRVIVARPPFVPRARVHDAIRFAVSPFHRET